jgi:hypothetical protein
MTARELAKELRRTHRDRFGKVAPRPDPDYVSEMVDAAEEALGQPLPKLVREVFRLAGPDFIDLEFGAAKYAERYRADVSAEDGGWPANMLPIKDLQGEIDWLCIDCAGGCAGPVYVFYDNWDGGRYWPDMFAPVSASLREFLVGFLEGAEFPPGRPDPADPSGRP